MEFFKGIDAQKVLITGVSGFLGFELFKAFSTNCEVLGLTGRDRTLCKVYPNIYTASEVHTLVYNPDIVILAHGAVSSGTLKLDAKELYDGNVKFTEEIIGKFPRARFIYSSSVSVFDDQVFHRDENSLVNPSDSYGRSKWYGEKLFEELGNATIIRFSSLYGVRMAENTMLPMFVNQALKRGLIEVYGTGQRRQNYLSVMDAVRLIQTISCIKTAPKICLGTNLIEHSNIEIAKIVAKICDAQIEFVGSDHSFSYEYENSITRTSTNWKPTVSMENGLKKYIKWKKEQ